MLPELQLITSKRDIFYVTTSPEFMPNGDLPTGKGQRAQLEYLLTPTNNSSNSRVHPSSQNSNSSDQEQSNVADLSEGDTMITSGKHLSVPSSTNVCSIQRVRSLQKERQMERIPLISKSKSCSESNPSMNGSNGSGNSDSDSNRLRYDILSTGFLPSNSSSEHNSSAGERGQAVKPLRIYRIPLAKLTGDHAHFNMQSFSALATPRPINTAPNTNTIFELTDTKTD